MASKITVTDTDKDRIVTMLSHQYISLRTEISEHMRGLYNLCATVGTVVVAAFSAGFYLWNNTLASTSIFNVAIPTLVTAGALGVLTATAGAIRISKYIVMEIEEPIRLLLGPQYEEWLNTNEPKADPITGLRKILGWESSLFSKTKGRMVHQVTRQNIFVVGTLFALIFFVSVVIGEIQVLSSDLWNDIIPIIRIIIGIAPLVLLLFGIIATLVLFRTMSKITYY